MGRFKDILWSVIFPLGVGAIVYGETRKICISLVIVVLFHEANWIQERLVQLAGSLADVYVHIDNVFYKGVKAVIAEEDDNDSGEPDPELRGRSRHREMGGTHV